MKTKHPLHKNIINGFTILLCSLYSFFFLLEFYIVRILKQTKLYPFGGEGPVPYYYKTAELYSTVSLVYGIAFGLLLGLAIWNLKKNNFNEILILGLTCLLIFIQLYHGWT